MQIDAAILWEQGQPLSVEKAELEYADTYRLAEVGDEIAEAEYIDEEQEAS